MPREGGPEVLRVHRRELPGLASGQVVVRVEAAGVFFAEVQMLKGRYFAQPKFSFVPSYELVGRVEEVGGDVDEELAGRRVAALTQTGGGGRAGTARRGEARAGDGRARPRRGGSGGHQRGYRLADAPPRREGAARTKREVEVAHFSQQD